MSDQKAVIERLRHLPSEVSLREILREIELIAGVKEGWAEIDRGQGCRLKPSKK